MEEQPPGLRKVSYAEVSTTVSVRPRNLEVVQVLRSELYGLARCIKQTSNEQQFLGVFAGAAIAFLIAAFTPGPETATRVAFLGLAALALVASVYLYRKSKAGQEEVDRIVREIEEDQPQRLRAI